MGARYGGTANSCDSAVREPLLFLSLAFILLSVMIVVRLLQRKRGQTQVGCQLSFLAAFWINYLFAPLVYLLPGYCGVFPELMVSGALVCLYGLLGFVIGSFFLPKLFHVRPLPITGPAPAVPASLRSGLLALGILFFIATHLAMGISGVQAIFSSGQQLLVVAVVLNIWEAARRKQSQKVAFWVAFSFLFPFDSVVNAGFLNFGMTSLAPVLIFATTCIGRKNYVRIAVLGAVGLYVGLSFFATYIRERTQIRATVSAGDRFTSRVERFARVFENFEWFSIRNPNHLDAVSGRLNYIWLVGAGVTYMENTQQWAHGTTLKDAALGFVPRVLWKNKPQQGGSELVSRYTGLSFSEGTSVPMGQVLELYVNFGPLLVFFGFLAIGGLLAYMDISAMNGLKSGTFNRFIAFFIVAHAFQHVANEYIAVVTEAVVGVGLTYGLQMFMRMKSRRRHQLANLDPQNSGYGDNFEAMRYSG
jgi:hypothetical protein